MRVFSLWLASRGDVALSISRTVARSSTFFGLTCGGVGSEADGVMVTVSVDQVGAGVMSTEDVLISVADTTLKNKIFRKYFLRIQRLRIQRQKNFQR